MKDNLGKIAVARIHHSDRIHGEGRIIAYCDTPTYTIKRENGTCFSWSVGLCEIKEEYAYEASGFYDQSGYVIYGPNGQYIEPWELVKILNRMKSD